MDWKEEGSNLVGVSQPAELPPPQAGVVDTHPNTVDPGRQVVKHEKRRALVWPTSATPFKVMKVLAAQYGDEGVRLVVWFDSD